MAASRYWRIVNFRTKGGDLELSALHLYDAAGRVDATIPVSCSAQPTHGAVANLADTTQTTSANFAYNDVISAGFWFQWDFGQTPKDISYVRLGATVLAKFAELVKRKGCRWFVIDPFNKVTLKNFKGDVNAYTAEYHQQLDAFETKYDCHIFLVVHPVKLPNKEGSQKTYLMPNAYHIKGGGEHFDMSYNIIGLVRDHELNMVKISTLKWKFQHLGSSGCDSWFGWNINNGRYTAPQGYYDGTETEQADINWTNNNWLSKISKEAYSEPIKEEPRPITKTPEEAFDVYESNDELEIEF